MKLSDKVFNVLIEGKKISVGKDENGKELYVGDNVKLSSKGVEIIKKNRHVDDKHVKAWLDYLYDTGEILGTDKNIREGIDVIKMYFGTEEDGKLLYSLGRYLTKVE